MNCLKCGKDTTCIDTRPWTNNTIRRRRKCIACDYRFNSIETAMGPVQRPPSKSCLATIMRAKGMTPKEIALELRVESGPHVSTLIAAHRKTKCQVCKEMSKVG